MVTGDLPQFLFGHLFVTRIQEISRGFTSPFSFSRARQIRLKTCLPLRCRLGR